MKTAEFRTSRIGRLPVVIPAEVKFESKGSELMVTGKLGSLSMMLPDGIQIKTEANTVNFIMETNHRKVRALQGLARSLFNNMVIGVSEGYVKNLQMIGVGYRASVEGGGLKLVVGKSHDVIMKLPAGITAEIGKRPTEIILKGIDKDKLGQFAADVIRQRPPEPYKGKGIRFMGQEIKLKAGKKAGK